ncbi:DUF2147 domain-containing protein [Rhodoferax sp. UBA5149]|uniref:DUF2147 domain-containing protein n=1 Tax=Rhodoferax sp. UBA5149 TaxID=1947379 RepID=UPI0025CF6C04|nr:DUF2147 domain-containing protein [Rhodoferax sp. UBA5149]
MTSNQWQYVALLTSVLSGSACAQSADDYVGKWMTAAGDGVVSLERCPLGRGMPASGLCGTVVWDRNVGDPKRTEALDCNRKVVAYARFDGSSWTRGWAFDSRTNRTYYNRLRLKDGKLQSRSYAANEMYGETEIWTRVSEVPPGCEGKTPGVRMLKGSAGN